MKKILLCLVVAIGLSNCEIKVKETKANDTTNVACGVGIGECITYSKRTIDGIEYAIFSSTDHYGGTSPFVINLTKEKLEIELLKKQLAEK